MIWLSWIQWGWIWIWFTIATLQDLRMYHVYDWIWLVEGIGATILHVFAINQASLYSWSQILVSFCIAVLFCGFLKGITRIVKINFLGNADYLALLCFTYTIPSYISLTQLEIIPREGILPLLDFLCNSAIIMILISVGIFLRNTGGILTTPKESRKMQWFGEFQNLPFTSLCRFVLIGRRILISQHSSYTKAVSLEVFNDVTKEWGLKGISQTLREDPNKMEENWQFFLEIAHKNNLQSVWIVSYIPIMGIFWISSLLTLLFGNWYFQILHL